MGFEIRTAIVTGARRGIGQAIAHALAEKGAAVVISDVNKEDCQKNVDEITKLGGRALAVECDVSSRDDVEEMVKITVAEFGSVDILVNNAGILSYKPILELTDDEWDKTISVNLKGQFICAQACAREMVKKQWGRIINIASISSGGCGIAFSQIGHYTASKGGVIGLTNALALELTPHGINVNAICPGAIDTPMTGGARESGQLEQILARIPKGRIGRPQEVADLAVFLASEEADYISGASVVIDGGWLTT